MGGEMRRVTVLGAVLIVILLWIAILTIQALTERKSGDGAKSD
jgi:hypothetical protein